MGFVQRPYPEFSWSESRARRFRECKRKHFLAVYQSHNGWEKGASYESRLAWTLGKLIPGWRAALGTAVHTQAVHCVLSCATTGRLPEFATLRQAAAQELNHIYRCSERHLRDFWNHPNRWPVVAGAF